MNNRNGSVAMQLKFLDKLITSWARVSKMVPSSAGSGRFSPFIHNPYTHSLHVAMCDFSLTDLSDQLFAVYTDCPAWPV